MGESLGLRVASFNIRRAHAWEVRRGWWSRRPAVVSVIRGLAADVVGVQEARPRQVRDLRRAFPSAVVVGAGRDRDGGGEHTPVLVDSRVLTVASDETWWLSDSPHVAGSVGWDAALPRIATLVRVAHGVKRIGIVNTHLDASGALARQHGAHMIAERIASEPDRAWVVVGDFNDVAGSPPLRAFTDAGLTDALAHVAGGTEHGYTGALDRTRIDHILVGPGIDVVAAHIDRARPRGRLASDHWPVVADLVVR